MRFSFWPNPQQPWSELLEITRQAESAGWDGIWYADHFMPDAVDTVAPWSEAWTTISALAASVPRVRIGTRVTGNSYRHPAVLAKMAATLDHISAGRVVLGLGSGWQENEHRAYGIPFYTIGERLARLDEACQVIKGLFSDEKTTFHGKFYSLEDAVLEPKPVQRPLPLLIGGGGEKVTLRITARHADEWNVWGDVDTLKRKIAILERHCADVGRDPKAIQRSAVALLFLSDDETFLARIRGGGSGRPIIAGNVDEVRETVAAYRDAGVDELIVPDFNLGRGERRSETLDRFIGEVAASFR